MLYPKVHNLFVTGKWAYSIFEHLANCEWDWYEKVAGAHVAITWTGTDVRIRAEGEMDPQLRAWILQRFTPATLAAYPACVFHGAGVGGDAYRDDPAVILFDVQQDGYWWSGEEIQHVGDNLDVPVAPLVGTGSLHEAGQFIRSKPMSCVSKHPRTMAGIIVHPRYGRMVIKDRWMQDWRLMAKVDVD